MNIILLLFIILATMFVASGINNVVTVMNGTDYYLDEAGVGDFIIISMGDQAVGCLDEMLNTHEAIDEYSLEKVVFAGEDNLKASDGTELECKNSTIFQSIGASAIRFFNADNQVINTVEKGHIYVSGKFAEENSLQVGDIICLEHCGTNMEFVFNGSLDRILWGILVSC